MLKWKPFSVGFTIQLAWYFDLKKGVFAIKCSVHATVETLEWAVIQKICHKMPLRQDTWTNVRWPAGFVAALKFTHWMDKMLCLLRIIQSQIKVRWILSWLQTHSSLLNWALFISLEVPGLSLGYLQQRIQTLLHHWYTDWQLLGILDGLTHAPPWSSNICYLTGEALESWDCKQFLLGLHNKDKTLGCLNLQRFFLKIEKCIEGQVLDGFSYSKSGNL